MASTPVTPSSRSSSQRHDRPLLPFWKQVIAGGTAGCLETGINYPIDIVKTRHQLNRGQAMTMVTTFRDIINTRGVLGMYRGILAPIAAETPITAIKFSACSQYKIWLANDDGYLPPQHAWIAGGMAGCTESMVSCPFEVVKIRMQSSEGVYRNTPSCAADLVRHEGVRGLYRGFEALLWRNGVWNACYFGAAATIRHYWPSSTSKSERMMYDFSIGAISGGIATTFNTPFDGIKSRLQNQRRTPPAAGTTIYKWAWPGLMTMAREEGFKSLYRGYAPRMLRLVPGGGIMLLAYDQMTIWLT